MSKYMTETTEEISVHIQWLNHIRHVSNAFESETRSFTHIYIHKSRHLFPDNRHMYYYYCRIHIQRNTRDPNIML